MLSEKLLDYIANLQVGEPSEEQVVFTADESPSLTGVDIDKLPNAIVTGSNLVEFPKEANSDIKSGVTLSLLAAQRVADNAKLRSLREWTECYNSVLTNLNWRITGGGQVDSDFKNINVAIHEAIIPFLAATFTGGVAAASLICTALQQLKKMDENSPWITLFDQQSRRFDVSEYQFAFVAIDGSDVSINLASARFNASFGKTQILFFKVGKETAKFQSTKEKLSADSGLLTEMNVGLKKRLAAFTKDYIQNLPI
jgi:hypothetical protein